MLGIFPIRAGIPLTRPTASLVMICTPAVRILGRFVIIVDASFPMMTGALAATIGIELAIPLARPFINLRPDCISFGRLPAKELTNVIIIRTAQGINCGNCAPKLPANVDMILTPALTNAGRFAVMALRIPMISVAP